MDEAVRRPSAKVKGTATFPDVHAGARSASIAAHGGLDVAVRRGLDDGACRSSWIE
jgi:hypothetical protein